MKNTQYYWLETGFEDYERWSIFNKYYDPGLRELLRKVNLHLSAEILDISKNKTMCSAASALFQ